MNRCNDQAKPGRSGAVGRALPLPLPDSAAKEATTRRMSLLRLSRRIEAYYFFNKGFLETDDQLLRNAPRIQAQAFRADVQGCHDVVCSMESVAAFIRAWPEADLIVTPDSGHSALDPPNSRALVAATDKFVG